MAFARRSTRPRSRPSTGRVTHTLGQVVHNEGVIAELQRVGVQTVESLDDVDRGAAIVIRAHGVRPDVMARAEERGLDVIDGTCTWVIQEQKELMKLVEEGYTIVLLGTPRHPEVVGLLGFAPDAIVVDDEPEWEQIPRTKKMALISQSTQPPWKFEKLAAFMVARSHELKIVNTVCPVTIRRQQDTLETAREVDLMVVVGGRSSANTKELTRLCEIVGTKAIQVESVADLADAERLHRRPDRRDHRRHLDADRGPPGRRRANPRAGRDTTSAARHARELAMAALALAATPAGRTTSLPTLGRRRRLSVAAGLPVVALVGRPNVGKSTLFNRILGSRRAIVEDRARTTRDRLYGNADWNGRRFVVVDTGGLEIDPNDPIEERVQDQARLAINEADVIVLVVDAATGPTPADLEAAALLRRAKSPILVAVNKADNEKRDLEAAEFHVLGWEEMFAISAAHGRGTGDLLDAIVWALPPETPEEVARKAREVEAQEWERDVAAGFILPDITQGPGARR